MIPTEIITKVRNEIEDFNQELTDRFYMYRFEDNFLFLYQNIHGKITLYMRLNYSEASDNWICYIYNYQLKSYQHLIQVNNLSKLRDIMQQGLEKKSEKDIIKKTED